MRSPRLTGSRALALLFVAAFPFPADAQPIAPTLSLVSARNGIAGTFRSPRSVYADATRIYLASDEGTLFVLARDAARNFPLLQTIRDATCPLAAVRGDGQYVYLTSWDGWLRIYRREAALRRVKSVFIPQGATGECFHMSGDMAVTNDALYISNSQSHVAVAGGRLFLSQLNAGGAAYEIPKSTFVPGRKFGTSFEPNVTVAFDLRTGARIGAVPNARDASGNVSPPVTLYGDESLVVQTAPVFGCGRSTHDARTLQSFINGIPDGFTETPCSRGSFPPADALNTVTRRGAYMVEGHQGGVWLRSMLGSPEGRILGVTDLRPAAGGEQYIGIYALWMDDVDDLVFGASWVRDAIELRPDLPALFVLRLNNLPRSFPVVNDRFRLSNLTTSCCAGSRLTVGATFTNISTTTIVAPVFEVQRLSGGNLLENADGAPGGVGATLTPKDLRGFVVRLAPGESTTVTFVVSLATGNPFQFLVDIRGLPPP